MVSTEKPSTGLRVAAIAALVPLGLWGFLWGLLPALGCGFRDDSPVAGLAVLYCGANAGRVLVWVYVGAITLLPIAAGIWARNRALSARSWTTLLGGLAVAAVSPVLFAYLVDALLGQ